MIDSQTMLQGKQQALGILFWRITLQDARCIPLPLTSTSAEGSF